MAESLHRANLTLDRPVLKIERRQLKWIRSISRTLLFPGCMLGRSSDFIAASRFKSRRYLS